MSSQLPGVGDVAEKAIATHIEKWKKQALAPGKVYKDKVKQAVSAIYSANKMRPPSYYIWLGSPIAGAMAAALISRWGNYKFKPNPPEFHRTITSSIMRAIENRTDKMWWRSVEDHITKKVFNGHARLQEEIRQAIQIQFVQSRLLNGPPLALQGIGLHNELGSLSAITNMLMRAFPPEFQDAVKPLKAGEVEDERIYWSAANATSNCGFGTQDPQAPFFEFCVNSGLKLPDAENVLTLARNCGWWWALEDVCIITARPLYTHVDENCRLHSTRGPAIQYPDSWEIYAWRGQPVPPRFTNFTRNMSAHDILSEPNAELRRLMLDAYGLEAFMLASGARKLQTDECGELWRQEMPDDEPIVMVRVTNSTPEPEGHFKKYFIRVPPDIRSAREAVAWTFGMNPDDYRPKKQT